MLIFVLRRAIVGALLQHGEYSAANADNAARALGGFALGLVGFSLYLFVLRGFYAHQDTRTPFVINVVQNVLNIALAVALVGRYGILGLGAALAISYVVCSLWALQVMTYKVPGFPLRPILGSLWRMLVAGAVAGEAAWLVASRVGGDAGLGGRRAGRSPGRSSPSPSTRSSSSRSGRPSWPPCGPGCREAVGQPVL